MKEQPQQVPDMYAPIQLNGGWHGIELVTPVGSPMIEETQSPQPKETINPQPVHCKVPPSIENSLHSLDLGPPWESTPQPSSLPGADEMTVLDSWDPADEEAHLDPVKQKILHRTKKTRLNWTMKKMS